MNKKYYLVVSVYTFVLFFSAASANAAGDNLLSIDKTILIQFVLVLVALFLLNVMIFKPLLGLLDRRKQLTSGTVEEAKQLTEKAQNLIEDYNTKINEARSEATEKRMEIRREAQLIAEKMIGEAREESQAVLEKYKIELNDQVSEIKEKIKPEIEGLAQDIATKVIGTEV